MTSYQCTFLRVQTIHIHDIVGNTTGHRETAHSATTHSRQLTVSSTHSQDNSQCRQLTARQVTAKTTHSHTKSQRDNSQPHRTVFFLFRLCLMDYYFLVSTGKFIFINHILRPLPVFTSLFPAPQSTWSTRNRDTHDIPYLKCRTTLGQKSFVLRAALFFNALPNDLKSSLFTSQFDRGFKRLLDDPVWFERYRAILFDNVGNV